MHANLHKKYLLTEDETGPRVRKVPDQTPNDLNITCCVTVVEDYEADILTGDEPASEDLLEISTWR